MEVYVARQPIFNEKEEVISYELLYRNSIENKFPEMDGDQATTELIVNSFFNIGINELSNGKSCFINFTENLLKLKVPTYFNPSSIVVEILETVMPTPEIIDICKELKELGYTIALDDFFVVNWNENLLTLLKYVDIIKIDFRLTPRKEQLEIINFLKPFHLKFLAEKVETREEYDLAKKDGYLYFQGYFFSKPIILNSHDIPIYYHSYFQILEELESPEPDIEHITEMIEHDISLSYKLLKLINTPFFRPKYEISSIKQAIVFLGLNEIKRWIYVLAVRGEKGNKEDSKELEMIHLSLARGKLSELLGILENKSIKGSKYFLLGMLSLLDSLLHVPMDAILKDLPLSMEIKAALNGEENDLKKLLDIAKAIERMDWTNHIIVECTKKYSEESLFSLYIEANIWANKILKGVAI